MNDPSNRILLISTVDAVKNITHAVIELFKSSFSSFLSSFTILCNNYGLAARAFATYQRYGANILKIVTYTNWVTARLTHRVLDVADKVNSPSGIAIVLVICTLKWACDGKRRMNDWTTSLTSAALSHDMSQQGWRTTIRKLFREATLTFGGLAPNVLHPKPRRDRKTAIDTINHIISQTAVYKPYHLQARPCQVGDDHRMIHHWTSDTSVLHNDATAVTPEHIVTQIDSDYYVDMNSKDILPFNPQLIYTFDPTEVASPHTDYPAWTFTDSETIKVTSPGEYYQHKLWDYTSNEIRLFRINRIYDAQFIAFEMEKRRVDKTHSLVLINPRVAYSGLFAYLAYIWFGPKPLTRVNVGEGEYARMEVQHQADDGAGKHTVSICRKGNTLAATCDIIEYSQMFELTMRSKLGCTVPKIKTKTKLTDAPAALLTNYLNDQKKDIEGPKTWYKNYALDYAIRTHQYFPDTAATIDPNPAVIPFANALFDGCFVHSNELGSEIQAIESRLTKLIKPFTMTAKHTQYMDEYILRLVPRDTRHTLIPCDDDEVFEHQNRPTQQTILEYALESNVNDRQPVISTFAKKEPAGKINDTRIISVGKAANKLRTSKYLYPFAHWLKKQKWYCFGKTPADLAAHLAKTARPAQTMNCTDFSRMDGRKNVTLRTFNYKLMVALFGLEWARDLRDLYEEGCHARGFTPTIDGECFFFETYMAWASGDPFTSSFNSADNSLVVFTGYVNKHTDNGKIPATQEIFDAAYADVVTKANIAGDDTVLGDMPDESIVRAATWWGHSLKSEVYQRGEPGVNFLARVYGPDLWEGDANSCTDLCRAISKIHATPNLKGFTPIDKMSMKLTSLMFTDGNSPIIRDLITTWQRVGGKLAERHNRTFMSYWSQYDLSCQYPNRTEDWMFELLPYEDIDWDLFHDFIDRVDNVEDFLLMPTILEVESVPLKGQQVVQTIADEQDFVGPDSERLNQPLQQELPSNVAEINVIAPTDTELNLTEFINQESRVESAIIQKDIKQDKGKEADREATKIFPGISTVKDPKGSIVNVVSTVLNKPNVYKGNDKSNEPPSQTKKVNKLKQCFFTKALEQDAKLTKKQLNKMYAKHVRLDRAAKCQRNGTK